MIDWLIGADMDWYSTDSDTVPWYTEQTTLICNDVGHAAVAVLSVNIKQEAEKPKIKI